MKELLKFLNCIVRAIKNEINKVKFIQDTLKENRDLRKKVKEYEEKIEMLEWEKHCFQQSMDFAINEPWYR